MSANTPEETHDPYQYDRGCIDCGALPGETCSDWCAELWQREQEALAPGGMLRDPWPEHGRHRSPEATCSLCRLLEQGYP